MKVWIVKANYGSWDSYHEKNLKVFDDEQKAKDFIQEYSSSEDIKIAKDLYRKQLWGGDEDEDGNIIEGLTEDDRKYIDNHPNIYEFFKLAEFNECVIEEFELN